MLSSVPVCRIVGTLRFRLSSRPSPRLSFRPSARLGVSGLLRLVRSSRVIVSQGVSFHPIVLVASSVLPCSGPCLIERGVNVSFLSWVSGASCRRLFCSHSRRSLARRRFPQLRFPSEISVDCPGSSCGMTWTSSSPPLRSRHSLLVLRSQSVRIGFSLVGSSVGPSRLPGWASRFPCRARCRYQPRRGRGASRSQGVFALRYPYAPFLSARFPHLFPIAIVVGGVRANRLTGTS